MLAILAGSMLNSRNLFVGQKRPQTKFESNKPLLIMAF